MKNFSDTPPPLPEKLPSKSTALLGLSHFGFTYTLLQQYPMSVPYELTLVSINACFTFDKT